MTQETRIENELNRLASLSEAAGGGRLLSLAVEVGQLECSITAIDRLACSFDRFTLYTDKLADATTDQLQRLAETLSERLSYLLEPVSTVEVDQQRCIVQMRSRPPSTDDEGKVKLRGFCGDYCIQTLGENPRRGQFVLHKKNAVPIVVKLERSSRQ